MPSCSVTAVLRKRNEYENLDNNIVPGEDGHHPGDEEGEQRWAKVYCDALDAVEHRACLVISERDVHMIQEEDAEEEKQEADHKVSPHHRHHHQVTTSPSARSLHLLLAAESCIMRPQAASVSPPSPSVLHLSVRPTQVS